jgi:hypothetical protein
VADPDGLNPSAFGWPMAGLQPPGPLKSTGQLSMTIARSTC